MLIRLDPEVPRPPPGNQVIPGIVQPLFNCTPDRDALLAAVRIQVSMLGFDSFAYAFSPCARVNPHFDR